MLIAGPTASGKTRAALLYAAARPSVVVNADAMQVYADIPILSGQPTPAERGAVPHVLFGYLDAAQRGSAGAWARDAAAAIADAHRAGRDAVVVGGTGLYLRALESGLSPVPDVPEAARDEARRRLEAQGLAAFRADLMVRDPATARLDPGDVQRHLRAAEVLLATGRPLAAFHTPAASLAAIDARIVVAPPRADVYAAAERRFDAMLAGGALDEAQALLARDLDPTLPAMKALGAPELMAFLRGETDLGDATTAAKTSTRRYVKRQLTWLRGQAPTWPRADDAEAAAAALLAAVAAMD